MKSAAGYYIGRSYRTPDCPIEMPYSRESMYFPTKESAQAALDDSRK